VAVPTGVSNQAPQNPGYQYGSFAQFGPQYANLPFVYPGGPAGSADAAAQQGTWLQQRGPALQQTAINGQSLFTACPQGACITNLASFKDLYAKLAPDLQPALANFTFSDAAFARMRITVAPLLLKRVMSMADLPIPPDSIQGLVRRAWKGLWAASAGCLSDQHSSCHASYLTELQAVVL
jgi:hypothetical protein